MNVVNEHFEVPVKHLIRFAARAHQTLQESRMPNEHDFTSAVKTSARSVLSPWFEVHNSPPHSESSRKKVSHMSTQTPLRLVATLAFGLAAQTSLMADETMTLHAEVWERNDTQTVPMGLLGLHNVPLSPERVEDWGVTGIRKIHHSPGAVTRIPDASARQKLAAQLEAASSKKEKKKLKRQLHRTLPHNLQWAIDCFYDRYQPALQVRDPANWETTLREQVRTFVRNARASGQQHYLEFWNESYLNWATNPAVNYSPQYYKTEGVQPGDPMVNRFSGETIEGLEWGQPRFYVPERGGINYVISGYILPNAKPGVPTKLRYGAGTATLEDGGTVKIRNRDWPVKYGPWGRDVKQKHYWSGPVNVGWYNEMFRVVGEEMAALKADDIPLAGGWGFNIFNENWDSWRYLIKPLIDEGHQWLDAIHEHHYGGDVRLVGCSYEVAYSYAQATYGNRLEFWNTEAGGHLDPQQPGNPAPHNHGDPQTKAVASMTYLLRDVVYQWAHVPDKAIFRAAHHSHHNGGDEWAFRLLKPMGGDILVLENELNDVWAVASTDAKATTVMFFNDRREEVSVTFKTPVSGGTATITTAQLSDGALGLVSEPTDIAGGQVAVSIPATSALRLELPPIKASGTKSWEQFCSPDVIRPLAEGVTTTIRLPEDTVAKATMARVRIVLDQALPAVSVSVNGTQHTLSNVPMGISDHSLPSAALKDLQKDNTIVYQAEKGRLLASSLWIEE
jgi:hypothetical protein